MSGIPIIGKIFDAIMDSPVLKAVVVAAAVWFTAGTATAYFAAPQAGLGAAMQSSASSMWTATTNFFGADAAASGAAEAAAEASSITAEAAAASEGIGATTSIAEIEAAGAGAGAASAAEPTLAQLGTAPTTPSMAGAQLPGAGALPATAPAAYPGAGIVNWMAKNPIPTMVIGQGLAGASAAGAEQEAADRAAAERRERGLMGFKYGGEYGGGVVGSQMQQPVGAGTQPIAAPTVAQQAPQQIMVPKEELPNLSKQGRIA